MKNVSNLCVKLGKFSSEQPAFLSLQLFLFSVISILFWGTVFGFQVILTFTGEIIVQEVILFIHAAQLGPAFNMLFMSRSLHPHASSIKTDTLYSEIEAE